MQILHRATINSCYMHQGIGAGRRSLNFYCYLYPESDLFQFGTLNIGCLFDDDLMHRINKCYSSHGTCVS